MSKIFWVVSSKPTGPYRSFSTRSWPTGWSDNKQSFPIATIWCKDEYIPAKVRTSKHALLKVGVAVRNKNQHFLIQSFSWRTLKGEWKTLSEAKEAAELFYTDHLDLFLTF